MHLTPEELDFLIILRNRPDFLNRQIIERVLPEAKREGNLPLVRLCYELLGMKAKVKRSARRHVDIMWRG